VNTIVIFAVLFVFMLGMFFAVGIDLFGDDVDEDDE